MGRIDSGVEHEAAVKQLRALRARQFAPKCDCSVLTEWGVCKRPACFDWDAASPAPRVGGGIRGDGGKIDISGRQFRSKPPISCKSIAFVDVKTA